MFNAQPSQFRLTDDGRILFQKDASNPLHGEPAAKIRKGPAALVPEVEVPESPDKEAVKDVLAAWLKAHIREVLEPLVALENTDELPGPARGICFQLYEAMGIVPRENLENLIGSLDSDMRQSLRSKQVRLGPVLVFLPALNKPAAVHLRGLLWSLWNDKPLPAKIPADGMVSFKIEPTADHSFYQAVGYPVYGPRAIRIDMLDRVINAVYENAKDGKFKAEHKMAEWLGSSIDDLYAVLEAMGHRKMTDSICHPERSEGSQLKGDPSVASLPQDDTEKKPETKPEVKPELATFRLKKGKAFEKEKSEKPATEHRRKDNKPRKKESRKSEEPRVISATPRIKTADSPFAVLEQLKVKKDASGS